MEQNDLASHVIHLENFTKSQSENIGAFIRQTYYLHHGSMDCCGINGYFVTPGNVSTPLSLAKVLPGNCLTYDLIDTVRKMNLSQLLKFKDIQIGEKVQGKNEIGNTAVFERISDNLYSISIDARGNIITTSIFEGLIDDEENGILIKDFDTNINQLVATFYFIFGYSRIDVDDIELLFERNDIKALSFPVSCIPKGSLTYEVNEPTKGCELQLKFNSKYIGIEDIKSAILKVTEKLENAL